jgi:hypothetical protein
MSTPRNFPVGTRVRSYDFPGERSCYLEGKIVSIDMHDGVYHIDVDRIVRDHQERPLKGRWVVTPPLNGRKSLFGTSTHGVVLAAAATTSTTTEATQ